MFKFLKKSENESTRRKKNALAGKTLLQSALLFSSKPRSSKLPSHRLTLSNLEWLELLNKGKDEEEEA